MKDSKAQTTGANELVPRIARKLVDAGLEVPAVFFLELHRPFGTIFYNTALLLSPAAAPFFGTERVKTLQELFADGENIDLLLNEIERYSFSKSNKTARISE